MLLLLEALTASRFALGTSPIRFANGRGKRIAARTGEGNLFASGKGKRQPWRSKVPSVQASPLRMAVMRSPLQR